MTSFALLLPVYQRDHPDHFRRAFDSAVTEQTRRPAQVIVVRDGPVGSGLTAALDAASSSSPVPVTRVNLDRNLGLGAALNQGLAACDHDVVARMDADDICLPHRFASQLPLLENGADLVGSALIEFDGDESEVLAVRTPPLVEAEIKSWARFHQPFNHPTVVYRKSLVMAVGGYDDLPLLEDYWLFVRMIAAGARVANLAEPLVKYRVGAGAYERRGGWAMVRSELLLQRRLLEVGFITRTQYARNVVVRGGYRLVPQTARRHAYRRLIARRGERSAPVV